MNRALMTVGALALVIGGAGMASAQGLCQGYGPQTPRDIAQRSGNNERIWTLAPKAEDMNLCNIHTHTNAEHKGPGFSVFVGDGDHGGYACNDSDSLSDDELEMPHGDSHAGLQGVKTGDTIEVHWVYTSCDIDPGPGLGSCLSDACANPELRVEAQVFLVVNDDDALDFNDYAYDGNMDNGFHQPKELPRRTGRPVVFAGSTTGTSYDQTHCSPLQVTWSVRPNCARVDINSLNEWADKGNVFEEDHSHGVRQLVTAPELLSEIKRGNGRN